MQDLEKDLERTKRIVEALRARPTGSSEDPAQAPQGVSSDGGTGMLGRIQEALAEESNLKLQDPTWMVAPTTGHRWITVKCSTIAWP